MIGWILQEMPTLEIVGIAADGLEGIQKAEDLQPDLIVMEIGLPRLKGMESAQRILAVKPQCKVLFLTQETSGRVVHNVFQFGAPGCVIKDHLVNELPVALLASQYSLSETNLPETGYLVNCNQLGSILPQSRSAVTTSP
jgi:DNA-binding NarL/FixJ family response regulator